MLYRNEEYEKIASELIETEECLEHCRNASIAVLSSDEEKTKNRKKVYGECHLIPDKYKWYMPFDFQITIYDANITHFDDKQLRILILHELMHIGKDYEAEQPKFYVVPHDYEEFRLILERYGIDWSEDNS